MRKAQRTGRAFTLIELLVVVSIIALLVSILMPALGKAREQAKRAVCGSNLHQLGAIVHLYANDFDDNLIPPFVAIELLDKPKGPFNSILPFELRIDVGDVLKEDYNMTGQMWMCPSMEMQRDRNVYHPYLDENDELVVWQSNGTYPDGYWIGYANLMNLHFMTSTFPTDVPQSPRKASESGQKHVAADLNLRWNDGSGDYIWAYRNSVAAHRQKRDAMPAGSNRLFLDGHVEWIQPQHMGYEDRPLAESEGKYDHAPSAGRDYYW